VLVVRTCDACCWMRGLMCGVLGWSKATSRQPSLSSPALLMQVLHDIAPAMGPRLRRLNLQHTLVADSGLLALAASCPLLETLLLGYCR
jgi:hypothetical protein